MKNENRVVLVLILSALIMIVWAMVFPKPNPTQVEIPQKIETQLSRGSSLEESSKSYSVGNTHFGIGSKSAGIRSIEVDGSHILEDGYPGFLQVVQTTPNHRLINFSDKEEDGKITGTFSLENGIQVFRVIENLDRSNYLKSVKLYAVNRGQEAHKIQLKLLAYRPLKANDEHEKQFLAGSVMVEGKDIRFGAHERSRSFPGVPSQVMSQGRSYATILKMSEPAGMFHVEHFEGGDSVGWLELPEKELEPGQRAEWDFQFYLGPMALDPLRQAGLEGSISFGAFSGITRILLGFLKWGYAHFHNYGLAICFLGFAVWLPFAPLTWYGMRASQQTMKKMALIKPQEARLRAEHKNNPAKMQQELMLLYKKHGVNPASGCIGCLPFVFTMPIYIALFQVLNRAPELRGASFLFIKDLASPDGLITLPVALPVIGSYLNLLPVISTGLSFVQQKAMQPPQVGELTEEQKMQQQMFKFMPVMFLFLFYNLPSGFMIYWVISSALTSTQQILVRRSIK